VAVCGAEMQVLDYLDVAAPGHRLVGVEYVGGRLCARQTSHNHSDGYEPQRNFVGEEAAGDSAEGIAEDTPAVWRN